MRLSTHLIRSIARLVLIVLVAGHVVQATQACTLDAARPAMAFTVDHCNHSGHDQPMDPTACLTQCLQGDRTSSSHAVSIPAASNAVVLVLPTAVVPPTRACAAPKDESFSDSGPPIPIRFCSFLI